MSRIRWDWWKTKEEPLAIPVVQPTGNRVRLPYAYACLDCDSINEGVTKGQCRSCGSRSVFHVRTLLNREQSKAAQRLKMQDAIREAKRRGVHNPTATLTEFRAPDDAA